MSIVHGDIRIKQEEGSTVQLPLRGLAVKQVDFYGSILTRLYLLAVSEVRK